MIARVAIVDDSAMSPSEKLAAALERAGFWETLAASCGDARIVIKPDMAGFTANSPCVTDPALVEVLIDLLHDHGFSNAAVVGTADSSSLWADNRDLYALADLLGYRFTTLKERAYDIVDLGDAADRTVFPSDSILHGGGLSHDWLDADVRIVFAKNRTDEAAGYALCLDGLIGVLPQVDKDLHYRRRRHAGDVVAALLDVAPVQFCLIDGVVSAHGIGGKGRQNGRDRDNHRRERCCAGGLRWCFEDGARSGRLADIPTRRAGTSIAAALYDIGITCALCRVEQRP